MVFLKTPRSSHKHGLPGSCSSPLMSPYLPRRSHWDNCAPIMEKLVGPEMSLSRCSLVSLGGVKPWRAAEEEEEEAPPLPGVLHKSAFTACLSSLLRCLCLLLQYHFNFALQVFYENTKWNKKRHGWFWFVDLFLWSSISDLLGRRSAAERRSHLLWTLSVRVFLGPRWL